MDVDLHFIPPCCIDNKLPRAIKQARHGILSFYTHGDVTFEKFYRAVSYLVPDSPVLVLSMPTVKATTINLLEQCFDRGWISDLILSTYDDITSIIDSRFRPYRSHIAYTHSKAIGQVDAHFALYTNQSALTISGPMFNSASQSVTLAAYTLFYHPDYSDFSKLDCGSNLMNVIVPDIMRHRLNHNKTDRKTLSPDILRFLDYQLPPFQNQE